MTVPYLVTVNDLMQSNYQYVISAPIGMDFHPNFVPELTPFEMLSLGIFGGKYMTDCQAEFPSEWYKSAKLCHERHNPDLNFFGVNAGQPLMVWRKKGWIHNDDPRGWFQWYCRYYMGRRMEDEDDRQVKRWYAMRRHLAQLKKHCKPDDFFCRRKQRQALLHWAYDTRQW